MVPPFGQEKGKQNDDPEEAVRMHHGIKQLAAMRSKLPTVPSAEYILDYQGFRTLKSQQSLKGVEKILFVILLYLSIYLLF